MGAILLLLFGGFIAGVGWLVGLFLLWGSRDKWIGTLVVPGGLATAFFAAGLTAPSHEPSTSETIVGAAVAAILVLGPVASAIYLARRARRSPT